MLRFSFLCFISEFGLTVRENNTGKAGRRGEREKNFEITKERQKRRDDYLERAADLTRITNFFVSIVEIKDKKNPSKFVCRASLT